MAIDLDKKRATNARWYLANCETVKARSNKWAEDHREESRAKTMKWVKENPEKKKASDARYCEENREKIRIRNAEQYVKNQEKIKAQVKKRRIENPEKVKSENLMTLYGITLNQKRQMMIDQGNCCKVCHVDFSSLLSRQIHVDHDHTTGRIRGILCQPCNVVLGLLKEDANVMVQMANYVKINLKLGNK